MMCLYKKERIDDDMHKYEFCFLPEPGMLELILKVLSPP